MTTKTKTRGRPVATLKAPNNKLGKILTTYRKNNKVGLELVASTLGVTVQFISNIERGRAPLPFKYVPVLSELTGISQRRLTVAILAARKNGAFITGTL